jgi:hypothetical protein
MTGIRLLTVLGVYPQEDIYTSSLAFCADLPFLHSVLVELTDFVETPIILFLKVSSMLYEF